MARNKRIASLAPRIVRPGELSEDYTSYNALLSDHLVLTMLVDRHGTLQSTALSRVAEFCREAVHGITEELVMRLGEEGDFNLGCYGSDMREDAAKCQEDLIQFEMSIAERITNDLFQQLRDIGETA